MTPRPAAPLRYYEIHARIHSTYTPHHFIKTTGGSVVTEPRTEVYRARPRAYRALACTGGGTGGPRGHTGMTIDY